MRSKTFGILVLVCAVLGGIAYLTIRNDVADDKKGKMGEKLLKDLSLENIAGITIKDHENAVTLKKGEKVWEIDERFSYPANFSKLNDVVEKLTDAKIGRSFKADDKTLSRLTLHSPDKTDKPTDERGSRIILMDKEGAPLADVIIGKTREGGSGNYVTHAEDYFTVYMVDKSFRFTDKAPEQWLDQKVMDVKAEDVEKVVCIDPESDELMYTLKRPEKGKDPDLADIPEGKKLKKSKAKDIFRLLSYFRVEDIAAPDTPASETGLNKALRFEFHLFDGTVYNIYPGGARGDEDDKFYLKADVGYVAPEIKVDVKTDAESEDKAEAEKKVEEEKEKQAKQAKAAEELNARVSPWIFIISKWKHDNFVTDPADFLEEAEKKEEAKVEKPAKVEPVESKVKEEGKPSAKPALPKIDMKDVQPEVKKKESKPVLPKVYDSSTDESAKPDAESSATDKQGESVPPKTESKKLDESDDSKMEQ